MKSLNLLLSNTGDHHHHVELSDDIVIEIFFFLRLPIKMYNTYSNIDDCHGTAYYLTLILSPIPAPAQAQ